MKGASSYENLKMTCYIKKNQMNLTCFTFPSFNSSINFINSLPRFPILYIIDSATCCYLVRSSLKIRNPLYSLVLSLLMVTTPDSISSYFTTNRVALLSDQYLAPIHLLIWLLFNFSPYDIIYRVSRSISPVLSFFAGLNAGRETTLGVDIAQDRYNFWVYKIVFAVLFASAKAIEISFIGRCMLQKVRSPGPALFEATLAAMFYYWITQSGSFFPSVVLPLETAKFITIMLSSILNVLRHYVRDEYYSRMWSTFENVFGSFIPYYGKTWIPPK
ncbi:hypothetical protein TRFO_37560 [Tritrichomonas foetus]|uniref:Uncharacterized protein n=1 Tax=Tritrichomonas foetus TaxID=1144522 RepID=A0A1J4JDC9_9EUKA|nr:hypothetical protein TRFO_37560 [Tritrichomonas foetus]|eukprot:OHS96287.1 hypothetical protein TRFO_37560 [Tritrichomonas foetus]